MHSDAIVIVGSISGPYGLKGWVHVKSFTEPPENLARYRPWLVRERGQWMEREPRSVRRHGQGLVASFPGVEDRDQAALLSGLELGVAREVLPPLDADEYYWRDLQGLNVIDQRGEPLGCVERLMDIGVHAVLVVSGAGREILIPFVPRHVEQVDLVSGRVLVNWDEPQ